MSDDEFDELLTVDPAEAPKKKKSAATADQAKKVYIEHWPAHQTIEKMMAHRPVQKEETEDTTKSATGGSAAAPPPIPAGLLSPSKDPNRRKEREDMYEKGNIALMKAIKQLEARKGSAKKGATNVFKNVGAEFEYYVKWKVMVLLIFNYFSSFTSISPEHVLHSLRMDSGPAHLGSRSSSGVEDISISHENSP